MADVEQPHVASPGQPSAQLPDAAPVPLSFPAVLRNSKLSDRFAHLHVSSQASPQPHPERRTKKERPEPEGKRWIRRRENAKFTHNPHIAHPTSGDFTHPLQVPSSTFPHPLPAYLPRNLLVPPARLPTAHPSCAGFFSLSLRGARRTLRARPSSTSLVKAVETHLVAWLQGGTYLNPDQAKGLLHFPGDPVGGREDLREVGREAARLVWAVKPDLNSGHQDGGFERYIVHCVARWYGVISFSREADGYRLTYLLRPNVTRPDPRTSAASRMLDTPPTTDVSDFHVSDTNLSDSNVTDGSDHNSTDVSDVDSIPGDLPPGSRSLYDIQESRPSSPDSWSVLGGPDFTVALENDVDDPGFMASMESLSLSVHAEADDFVVPSADTTLTPSRVPSAARAESQDGDPGENSVTLRARVDRNRMRTLYHRSASSPSPARRSSHRSSTTRMLGPGRKRKVKKNRKGPAGAIGVDKGSFYDYLYA